MTTITEYKLLLKCECCDSRFSYWSSDMYHRKRDPNRKEVVDPCDLPLTADEASKIAEIADGWPGGLGEVLVKCETAKRGWKRDPEFSVFKKDYVPAADVMLCPVMALKKMRGLPNLYHHHLSAWRSIRNAYAEVLCCTLKDAHDLYNEHLRNDPKTLAKNMRRYVLMRVARSGTKSPSWYILYELVDDFGNYITPQQLGESYHQRLAFFKESA